MSDGGSVVLIALAVLVVLAALSLFKAVRFVPQARVDIVERFGKYRTTLNAGPNLIIPFVDKPAYRLDLREQVVAFPPQNMITQDNLTVNIDTVIYFVVTDPVSATYEIENYIRAIETLTMTTLRNIVGGMDLEETLTSRDRINTSLNAVLDEATGKWGLKANRVEIQGIDPPGSIKDSMEKQMRADRDKRAAILTAEGHRQSAILTAEGNKQSSILEAEGERESAILRAQADREAAILRAQGEGQAIQMVFQAIHDGQPDQALLAYQYLQMMPKIAEGTSNKVWIVPSEMGKALEGLGNAIGGNVSGVPAQTDGVKHRIDLDEVELPGGGDVDQTAAKAREEAAASVEAALAEARRAANPNARAQQPAALDGEDVTGTAETPAAGMPDGAGDSGDSGDSGDEAPRA